MGSLFGKPKKNRSRVTQQDKAVLQLKQMRDKLKQYQKKITLNMENERELAKKLLLENKKERAKLLLRKKKFQEQILQKTDLQLENLDKMAHDIEFAMIEVEVIKGLKDGNQALEKIHAVMTVDHIERILDETQEAVEKQRELDELLSGSLTTEDEDDVMTELNNIIKENLPELPLEMMDDDSVKNVSEEEPQLLDDVDIKLPDVPTSKIENLQKPKRELVAAS